MTRALIVQGGYRLGDTAHLIPILRKLGEKHDEITWVTGQYAEQASRFLASIPSLKIKNLIVLDEYRQPGDISDRERFVNDIFKNDGRGNNKINPADYDEVITDVRCSFEIAFNYNGYVGNYPELTYLDLPIEKKFLDYICVQPDSISKQKTVKSLVNIDYPLQSITIGNRNELLVFKSQDKRGVAFSESIQLLYQSRFNICIHSAMACFSFYLDKPTIIIHFFDGQFKFSKFHSNCLDLITPNSHQIEQAMSDFSKKFAPQK